MIPGPCSFYLRPGQTCEVRDAHELGSSQYLVVKCYGEVDADAPYYEITKQSIGRPATSEDSDTPQPDSDTPKRRVDRSFQRGMQVVIRGIDTQFYIPPTGMDVVPDTSFDASGATISGEQAREILSKAMAPPPVPGGRSPQTDDIRALWGTHDPDALLSAAAAPDVEASSNIASGFKAFAPTTTSGEITTKDAAVVQQAARRRHRVRAARAEPKVDLSKLVSNLAGTPALQEEVERQAKQARLVRNAVVLTEKEFCVIIDEDGRRKVSRGPDRVFPGPYDTFMTEGSRNRVYDAYELLPQRALWLRVIGEISKDDLASRLPNGASTLLAKENYYPGDEILLKKLNAFFFPFDKIEVLSPSTGQAVVGNDHDQVLIEAIGIDQKSGIYTRQLETGAANLVRGKISYLVDPAKEVHIYRTVSAEDWNHWILAHRPHKDRETEPVVTPWAISIRIPANQAILATSATGQRVVEGPCVELLEYEEKLASMSLSTGRPKSSDRLKKTCFLRTNGNRVTDVIRIETADFVEIDVRVTYHVTFEQSHRDQWFNHSNYVQVLCEHLRSLVRNHGRQKTLANLWPSISNVIRDLILGQKDSESGKRPGRFFEENGMRVVEVEVLTSEILDQQIAEQFTKVQRQIVQYQIGDQEVSARLASDTVRAEADAKQDALRRESERRKAELGRVIADLKHATALHSINLANEENILRDKQVADREELELASQLERAKTEAEAKGELTLAAAERQRRIDEERNALTLKLEEARHALEKALIAARAEAKATENQSIQPGLIEAMTALGDKLFMTEAAQNMNLVSLFKGEDFGEILSGVFDGTRVAGTIASMRQVAENRIKELTSANGGKNT
jgi:major vault protein